MSKFFDWLGNYVRTYMTSELSIAGDGNFRSVFTGLPEQMLDELMKGLVSDGFMHVNVAGNEEQVIVLLPAKAESNPDGISSGRCTQGYLVSVRNSLVKRLLTLQPPGETQIKSIRSTVTQFGVSPTGLTNAEAWSSDAFVRDILLDAVRNRIIPSNTIPRWFIDVMSRLAILDEIDGHTDIKWEVIRRLFDQQAAKVDNGNFLVIFAATGLVRPSNIEEDYEGLPKLVEAIGEFLEREGLVQGFNGLRESAEQLSGEDREIKAIISALNEFEEHVFKVAKSAPEFASAALRYYCPYEKNKFDEDIPNWWHILDANTWQSLLDGKPAPNSYIGVKVTNGVAPYESKGLPSVTNKKVDFEITIAEGRERPDLQITRRVGRQEVKVIGSIERGFGNSRFSDDCMPSHSVPLTYTFEPSNPEFKSASVKVIVLSEYEPGFVASSRGATKVTLPKKVNPSAQQLIFECDLELSGEGIHQVDLLAREGLKIEDEVYGYGVTMDDDDESETRVTPASVADNQWNFDAETDEECRYEFDYVLPSGWCARARLNLRAGNDEPAGVSSEFHRLILEISRGRSSRITIRENQRVYSLQRWILADKHSYRPLLISPSFEKNWDKPDWSANPRLSAHAPIYDPRPDASEFIPPNPSLT